MADQTPKSKKRRLRPAQTMRERAEHATVQNSKPKRGRKVTQAIKAPFRVIGRVISRIGRLPIWKPFKFIGRFIIPPFLRASWRELRLVTWPNSKQTRQLTSAVIAFSVIFGLFVAAFDYGLDKLFKQVILK